ncbi:MAG: STAS domain-containing protein [Tepidisphaeraceae bacterium]
MSVKCEQYNQVCVMAVAGDFSGENTVAAKKAVEENIDQHQVVDFIVDLEKADFLDSDGLETLLWIKRRCEDLFGQVKLVNLGESVRKILEITRLEHRFECHAELAAALKTMR